MEKIIYDTDMDTDCDDAGALGLLMHYVKAGKGELLGIIADTPVAEAAPCCEAICRWYGTVPPIGAVSHTEQEPRFAEYCAHRGRLAPTRYYNRILAEGIETRAYPDAADLYRRLLEGEEDHSVTIVCVGLLTALADLLETADGAALLRRKVKRLVTMGDATYPQQTEHLFNYQMDRIASSLFFQQCPVDVTVSPAGKEVITGGRFSSDFPEEHPLRIAYERFRGPFRGRSSWDLIAVLTVFEPQLFKEESHGTVRYSPENRTYWENGPRNDRQITPILSDRELEAFLEARLF